MPSLKMVCVLTSYLSLMSGVCPCAQFLGFGLLLTSMALRRWRETRFGPPWLRSFLADYGVCRRCC